MYVVNRTRATYLGIEIKRANSILTRMLGLYAHRQLQFGDGVWLVPCNAIQTIGMRFPIDLVFMDAGGRVVRVCENVQPGRVVWRVPEADSVLEVPAGVVQSSETQVGDTIGFFERADVVSPVESRPERA